MEKLTFETRRKVSEKTLQRSTFSFPFIRIQHCSTYFSKNVLIIAIVIIHKLKISREISLEKNASKIPENKWRQRWRGRANYFTSLGGAPICIWGPNLRALKALQ
jgi:hypothetical protein